MLQIERRLDSLYAGREPPAQADELAGHQSVPVIDPVGAHQTLLLGVVRVIAFHPIHME